MNVSDTHATRQLATSIRRPKVAHRRVHIVIDVEGWAYHHAALAIKRYAPRGYTVTIGGRRPTVSDLRGVDLVHFLTHNQSQRIATAVRTHCPNAILVGSLNSGFGRLNGPAATIMQYADAIIHVNWESYERYGCRERHYQISRGVDLNVFHSRIPVALRKRRVLWTGSTRHRVLKGHPILTSLKRRLEKQGIELDLRLVDSHNPVANQHEMAEWYNTGAVYVVASASEGTPNPALESAACGCALVATGVGNIPELVSDDWNGVVIADRHPDTICKAILNALRERERYVANMQNVIIHWNWSYHASRYFDLFDRLLNGTPPPPNWNQRFSAESVRNSLSTTIRQQCDCRKRKS